MSVTFASELVVDSETATSILSGDIALIVGLACGGVILLALFIGVTIACSRRHRLRSAEVAAPVAQAPPQSSHYASTTMLANQRQISTDNYDSFRYDEL